MARCNKKDIDVAWEAVRHNRRPSVVIFIATSEIHMKHKLRMSKADVLNTAAEMVAYARSLGCQFVASGAEDAGSVGEHSHRLIAAQEVLEAEVAGLKKSVGQLQEALAYCQLVEEESRVNGEKVSLELFIERKLLGELCAMKAKAEEELAHCQTSLEVL
ncbi:hypothetical protein J5N97_020259 [Dioscorea zingiberensis]|uniref:Pyruvate carboxyltransferase domain-containing protein n=1 Tax=Dioscorea zingiberensis TaxID=325984 RepID=A0A9D5HDH1_9LILI|nr:hypothetical protein J5N97_020259 [Dioscorea zingiberensis]